MVLLKRSHCSMQTPLVCPTTHFRLAVPQYSLRPHDHSGVLPPFNRTRRPCGSTPFQPRAGHDNRLFPFFPIPLRSSSGFRAPPPRPATTEDVLSAWSSHVVAGFVLLSCPARSSLSHVARFSLPFSFFISFSLSSSFILVRHARCVVSPGAPASSFGHGARHTVRVRPFAFFFLPSDVGRSWWDPSSLPFDGLAGSIPSADRTYGSEGGSISSRSNLSLLVKGRSLPKQRGGQ